VKGVGINPYGSTNIFPAFSVAYQECSYSEKLFNLPDLTPGEGMSWSEALGQIHRLALVDKHQPEQRKKVQIIHLNKDIKLKLAKCAN